MLTGAGAHVSGAAMKVFLVRTAAVTVAASPDAPSDRQLRQLGMIVAPYRSIFIFGTIRPLAGRLGNKGARRLR